MLTQQAKQSALKLARQYMPRRVIFAASLLPAILLTAVGAPFSQMLRLAVVSQNEHAQYQVVFAGGLEEVVARGKQQKADASKSDKEQKNGSPRILKPVSDIWESAPRVEFSSAEVPLSVETISDDAAGVIYHPEFSSRIYRNHSPPVPLARGPPLNA